MSVVAVCDEFFAGKLVGTGLRLCKQKDDDEDSEHRFSLTKTSAFSSHTLKELSGRGGRERLRDPNLDRDRMHIIVFLYSS